MNNQFSSRARAIGDSATLVMSAKAKAMRAQGLDVINFSAGEPDFPTPAPAVEAAQAYLAKGFIRYTASMGLDELREAVAARYSAMYGLQFDAKEAIIGSGGKQVIYNAVQVICEAGDEVIIPGPYWVSYPAMVTLAGAKPVVVSSRFEDEFDLDVEELRSAVSPRTKALIINTPSNPTGMRLSRTNLEEICALAIEHDLWILADEIYDELCYDSEPYLSPIALSPELRARTVALNSFSKTYSMTGWRLGYAIGPADLIAAMGRIQAHQTSNPCTLSQVAGIAAMRSASDIVAERRDSFKLRGELMYKLMRDLPNIDCLQPQGAFYVFPKMDHYYGKHFGDQLIQGSMDLSLCLLENALVATVPGEAFGDDRHIRLSYPTSEDLIRDGVARVAEVLAEID